MEWDKTDSITAVFGSICGLACLKSTFKSRKDTIVNAAILCLTVCVCDVMSKAGMCSRSAHYVMSQPSLFFLCEERASMAALWEIQIRNKQKTKKYFCCLNIDRPSNEAVNGNIDLPYETIKWKHWPTVWSHQMETLTYCTKLSHENIDLPHEAIKWKHWPPTWSHQMETLTYHMESSNGNVDLSHEAIKGKHLPMFCVFRPSRIFTSCPL